MAELVDAEPGLDPDLLFDGLPSDLWGALVLQVIGQQLSLAAAAAILTRLEALQDGRMPLGSKTAGWTSIACAPSTTTRPGPHLASASGHGAHSPRHTCTRVLNRKWALRDRA